MTERTWREWMAETGNAAPWWCRWVTLIYDGDRDEPTIRVPYLTRRQAQKEADYASRCNGLGVAVGETVRVRLTQGAVRAEVARLSERQRCECDCCTGRCPLCGGAT